MNADPPGLDLARLSHHLEREGLTSGPLRGEVIHGGKSNLTYVVRDRERTLVVRRPPLGHVLATAHDMGREHRVMTALGDTGVPVPVTYHLCQDPDVIGAPFYVMEYVEGGHPPVTPKISRDLVGVLATLHSIEPDDVGLGDFGRPEGFLERQVGRWKRQLDASRSREVPGIDDLFARLARAVPESGRPAIVHGDFKLGNTLIADGEVRAVLDWEMSTLGDPLTDLALFLLYGEFAALDSGFAALDGGHDAEPAESAGSPEPGGSPELAGHYAAVSGRDLSRLGWYIGLACFKLAVIAEGIHFRYVKGLTVGEGFAEIGDQVAPLVARGLMEV
ncbi:phosphotransferase family protein [Microtetraspora sp. NBRC 16547]|uniref:phosphotransferase family protein n=1 Tax=Microtetraspora sp. NBRC 16547 TaxID=3030993 RepID=UPI0024A0B022|nr:phosphotransferase family protein [Microtetraspora sp. NBRC 16547]GLX02495.1 acyl-CoA dehydrogenase [Microtetraspora sp. NBRC 16547]